jgi:hypothetical protein
MKHFTSIIPFFFLTLLFLCDAARSRAQTLQEHPIFLRVIMKDESVLIGRRLAMTENELVIEMSSIGKVNLPLSDVVEIREISFAETVSKFSRYNRAANQGIIGTTAFGLNRGEFQFSNFLLGYNQIGVGIFDRVTLYAGVELISIIAGAASGEFFGPGIVLRTHYAFPSKNSLVRFGAGVAAGGILGGGETFVALPYGVMTLGDEDTNFTAGINLAFSGGFGAPALITLAGNKRLSRSVGLITEHWISVTGNDGLITLNMAGVRFYGGRTSWKVALVGAFDQFSFGISPIPLVGVVRFFR